MKAILETIRAVELTEALAGPYCAMLLGDLGADVIKIERPGVGDQSRSRGWGPPFVGGESAYFLAANRNKRSITFNYDHPRGAEVFQKLLSSADVFLHNQPSLASLQKRGIDAETLCAKNTRLIYCSITGYGFTGPKAGMPGYDILAHAEAGVMSFTGEPAGGPVRYPIAIADMTCGMYAAMGILAALLHREKTGRGQILDMALFDSQLTWLANVGSSYLNARASPQRCLTHLIEKEREAEKMGGHGEPTTSRRYQEIGRGWRTGRLHPRPDDPATQFRYERCDPFGLDRLAS